MSKGLLASIAVFLAGVSTALGQTPVVPVSATGQTPAAPASATGPVIASPAVVSGPAATSPILTTAPIEVPVGYGYPTGYPNGYTNGYTNGCMQPGCNSGLTVGAGECDCPWYGRADYLLMWTKSMPNSTPMVTSVAPGTPTTGTPVPGAIGGAGTTVIMGGSDEDLGTRQGGKFTVGRYLDAQQTIALEGSYWFLGSTTDSQSAYSLGGPGAPTLMIPFNDVTGATTGGTPGPSALLPSLGKIFNVTGGLNGPFVSHDNLYFKSEVQGADGYGVFNLTKSGRLRVDGLFGFRWLNLNEQEDFTTTNETVNSAPEHIVFNAADQFETSNNFYGGLLGMRVEYAPDDGSGGWRGGFCYRGAFLFALGDTVERININGATSTNIGNPPVATNVNYAGGVFAQPTNMGAHDNNQFAFVPEGNFALGYAFASWGRVMIGYDVIYISDVARPGDQIDSGVNLSRSGVVQGAQPPIAAPATDPNRPSYNASQSTFWAQGLTLGVELHW